MFIHVASQQTASKNAKNLSKHLTEVVRAAKTNNKSLNHMDLRQAMHLTNQELRGELGGPNPQVWALIGVLVALLVGALSFLWMNR